ncbi:MAG TPA: hypothetical protein VEJ18_09765, partial [Planctomycetota bacterium]|nr:hypothetical protein [Planctomycetota bacterium]
GRPLGGVPELAKATGGDLEKVRRILSTIRFEPYAGVLKGAEGAWATGAANSFDLSLLGAEMLSPFARVRFTLGSAPAEDVKARLRTAAEAPVARLPEGAKPAVDPRAAAEGRADLWRRVDGTVAALEALLKAKGIPLGDAGPAPDLAWCGLEVEREGRWEAVVPPLGEVAERLDALPDRVLHRIEVAARLERSAGGKVASDEILRVSYPARELLGRPLTFQIVPAPGDLGLSRSLISKDAVKMSPLEGLRAVKRFVPSVVLGTGGQYGKAFDLDGKIYAIDPAQGFSLAGADAVGDRVGGLLGRRRGPEIGPPTALTWSLRRIGPDGSETAWDREVVDLIGHGRPRKALEKLEPRQEDRLRLAFLGRHSVFLHAGDIGMAEGLLRIRRAMEPWRGFLKEMRAHRAGRQSLAKALQHFEVEETAPTAFAVMRGSFRRELETRAGARSWTAAAGLVVLHAEVVPAGDDRYALRESFDIVDLPLGVEGPSAGRFRLAQGVLDTELELETCDCRPPMYNTASMIRRAKAELRCLTAPEEVDALPYKDAAKARLKAELGAGYVAVAPTAEIDGEAAWWRIDPRSGAALGIGETGYGQTATEYWLTVNDRIKETYGIGKVIYCYLMAIWSNPLGWDESVGVVASPKLLGEILKCIPICKGLKKVIKFPEDTDPLAPFIGHSIEGEMKFDANDACKEGEKALDSLLGN